MIQGCSGPVNYYYVWPSDAETQTEKPQRGEFTWSGIEGIPVTRCIYYYYWGGMTWCIGDFLFSCGAVNGECLWIYGEGVAARRGQPSRSNLNPPPPPSRLVRRRLPCLWLCPSSVLTNPSF